jgi:hypothetical protein
MASSWRLCWRTREHPEKRAWCGFAPSAWRPGVLAGTAHEGSLGRSIAGAAHGDKIPPMAQKPIDEEVAHRFAELVGLDLTQHEAARAVELGTRTGERLMTKPEIRQIVKETRAARSGMGNGDPAIWALLEATDEEGKPDWERRAKGAELALDQLAGEGACGQSLPAGFKLLVPRPPDEQPLGTASG